MFSLLVVAVFLQANKREVIHVGVAPATFFARLEKFRVDRGGTNMPLAESAEMQSKVNELLRYDEATYFNVLINGVPLSVYAAYWSPGRQRPRYVGDHTPDICWTLSGMSMSTGDFPEIKAFPEQPQFRVFQGPGGKVEVIYIHTYGGHRSGYAEGARSKGNSFIRSFEEETLSPLKEQYFVRISCPGNLTALYYSVHLSELVGIVS